MFSCSSPKKTMHVRSSAIGLPKTHAPIHFFRRLIDVDITPFSSCTGNKPIRLKASDYRGKAQREAMLLLAFVRGLFRFRENRPAFAALFQLPPRSGKRSGLYPMLIFLRILSIRQASFLFRPAVLTNIHIFSLAKSLNLEIIVHIF